METRNETFVRKMNLLRGKPSIRVALPNPCHPIPVILFPACRQSAEVQDLPG